MDGLGEYSTSKSGESLFLRDLGMSTLPRALERAMQRQDMIAEEVEVFASVVSRKIHELMFSLVR